MTAQARLGWTLAECIEHYGKESKSPTPEGEYVTHCFQTKLYGYKMDICVSISTETHLVDKVKYLNEESGNPFPTSVVHRLLHSNFPAATWEIDFSDETTGDDDFEDRLTWFGHLLESTPRPVAKATEGRNTHGAYILEIQALNVE